MQAPVTHWLPTDPPRPAPALMTEPEVIELLRLDGTEKQKRDAMAYLRQRRNFPHHRVSKNLVYPLDEVLEFVKERC